MEPFSVAAAAVTLCPMIIQITRSLRNAAKSIKYARRELEDLTNEMIIFNGFYRQFLQVCSGRMKKDRFASSARILLKTWAEKAMFDFEKLSRHADALSTEPFQYHSATETLTAHLKWYSQKSTLEYLRASLIVARQSMLGFTNLCNIEKLDEQLEMLSSALTPKEKLDIKKKCGKTVEELIQLLQQDKDTQRMDMENMKDIAQICMEKISLRQSQSQDLDFTGHTERLLHFSSLIDRHAERVLPSNESSNRNSRFSNSPSKRPRLHTFPSQSSGTMYTRSSQSSRRRPTAVPDSPPTSPEAFSNVSYDREVPSSSFVSCWRCGGTCMHPEVHGATIPKPVQCTPRRLDPHAATKPTIRQSDRYIHADYLRQRRKLDEERSRIGHTASGHYTLDLPSRSGAEPQETIKPFDNAANAHDSGDGLGIESEKDGEEENIASQVEDGEEATDDDEEASAEDTADEEEVMQEEKEPVKETEPSIWQPTGAFGGREPRNLRERRERSSSPQHHWSSKPWEKKNLD